LLDYIFVDVWKHFREVLQLFFGRHGRLNCLWRRIVMAGGLAPDAVRPKWLE
jgi:hypothetical protein